MQTGYFVIAGENCFDQVNNYIKQEYKVEYEKPLHKGILYCTEEFSMLANNELLIVITVEKVDDKDDECEIEIIAGGGGSGIFAATWGNEERRVSKFYNRMLDFCNSAGFKISALAEQ